MTLVNSHWLFFWLRHQRYVLPCGIVSARFPSGAAFVIQSLEEYPPSRDRRSERQVERRDILRSLRFFKFKADLGQNRSRLPTNNAKQFRTIALKKKKKKHKKCVNSSARFFLNPRHNRAIFAATITKKSLPYGEILYGLIILTSRHPCMLSFIVFFLLCTTIQTDLVKAVVTHRSPDHARTHCPLHRYSENALSSSVSRFPFLFLNVNQRTNPLTALHCAHLHPADITK